MRTILSITLLALFSGALAAQAAPGVIRITKVVHEPNEEDVGDYIKNLLIPNPDFDPLQPTGQPQMIPAWGNGRGISNELDSVSSELYAIGGTTTHDLLVMTNNFNRNILIDTAVPPLGPGPGIVVTEIRSTVDLPSAPEQVSPGHAWMVVIPFHNQQVSVPDDSTVAVWMLVTKWFDRLDTSPRDYIVTFQFDDVATGPTIPMVVEVPLTVPRKDGESGSSCTVGVERGIPHGGVALLAGTAAVAITRRRRVPAKA